MPPTSRREPDRERAYYRLSALSANRLFAGSPGHHNTRRPGRTWRSPAAASTRIHFPSSRTIVPTPLPHQLQQRTDCCLCCGELFQPASSVPADQCHRKRFADRARRTVYGTILPRSSSRGRGGGTPLSCRPGPSPGLRSFV